MGLRDEQRELTRRTVLGAVIDLVAEGSLDGLSIPAVAERSGVSIATIYRYFPTRDELLVAASGEPSRRVFAAHHGEPRDHHDSAAGEGDDDLGRAVRAMWREFSGNLPLLRHQIGSEAGREMRRARLDDGRRRLAAYVEGFGIDPTTAAGERLVSLLVLVSGSLALVELHDRQGLAVDEAIDASVWAVKALVEATTREDAAS